MALRALTAVGLAVIVTLSSYGNDVPVAIGNVPEVVINSAKASFPGKIKQFVSAEKRTIDKKVVHYSIELKMKDKTVIDAYFTEDGKLFRTGVSITKEDVPEAVRDAFQKTYSTWVVTDLNKETDLETKAEFYSVDIDKDGKSLELDFSPDGKIVKILELKKDD